MSTDIWNGRILTDLLMLEFIGTAAGSVPGAFLFAGSIVKLSGGQRQPDDKPLDFLVREWCCAGVYIGYCADMTRKLKNAMDIEISLATRKMVQTKAD